MDWTDEAGRHEIRKLIGEHLKRADKYLKAGQYERAFEEIERAYGLDSKNDYVLAFRERLAEKKQFLPTHLATSSLLGTAGVKTQEPPDGLGSVELRVLRHIDSARVHLAQKEYEKALEEVSHALQADPRRREALELRGRIEVEIAKSEGEREEVSAGGAEAQNAEETGPPQENSLFSEEEQRDRQVTAYLDDAERLIRNGVFDQARTLIEKAFNLNPRDPRAPNVYTHLREAMLFVQKRKQQEEARKEALEKKVRLHAERAQGYLLREKFEKALDEATSAYALDPRNIEIRLLIEKIEASLEERRRRQLEEKQRKEEEERRRVEEEARKRREEEERQRREEEERRRAEEEAKRQAILRKIKEHFEKAEELLHAEKFQRALQELQQIYLLEPDNSAARQLEELIHFAEAEKQRREEEARRKAEEEERRRKIERKIHAYIEKASEYVQKGKLEKALEEVTNVFSIDANHSEARELADRIQLAIENEKKREEEERRKREEEARRQIEEELRRRHEVEERRRRAEEARLKAEELSRRMEHLQRINEYLHKALRETANISATDPESETAKLLEEALLGALERIDRQVPSVDAKEFTEISPKSVLESEGVSSERRPPISTPADRRPLQLRPTRRPRKSLVFASITGLVLLGGLFLLGKREVLFPERRMLLVLPLEVYGGQDHEAQLADVLTAGLIEDFSSVEGVPVINAVTAFSLRQRNDPLSAGKEVGATHVLHGTLAKRDERLTLNLVLQESFTGKTLWRQELSSSAPALLEKRSQILEAVLLAVGAEASESVKGLGGLPTRNPEALEYYSKALPLLAGNRKIEIDEAIKLLDEAVKRDDQFALALACRGALSLKTYERGWKSDPDWLAQAKTFSERALKLNPRIALAHRTLGSAFHYLRDHGRALRELEESIALQPNDASGYRALALLHATKGDEKRAESAADFAIPLDPLNYETYLVVGITKQFAGRYDEAVAAYGQAVSLEPGVAWELNGLLDNALLFQGSPKRAISLYQNYLNLHSDDYVMLYKVGRANQMDGKIAAAQSYFERVVKLATQELKRNPGGSARAYLYMALAETRMGRYRAAEDLASRALRLAPEDPEIFYGLAAMYSMQRSPYAATEWLAKAIRRRYSYRNILDFDLYNLKTEPGFSSTLQGGSALALK